MVYEPTVTTDNPKQIKLSNTFLLKQLNRQPSASNRSNLTTLTSLNSSIPVRFQPNNSNVTQQLNSAQ
jgi:hypothetical protein